MSNDIKAIRLTLTGSSAPSTAAIQPKVVKLVDQDPGRRIDRGVSPIQGRRGNLLPFLVAAKQKGRYSKCSRISLAPNAAQSAADQLDRSRKI
jgi:hypothetical protein